MRLIRNLLILVLLLLIGGALFMTLSPKLKIMEPSEDAELQSLQLQGARIKLAYILDKTNWLSYSLQKGDEQVRVISNVILDKNYKVSEDERFLYSILFEVLDEDESVIKSGEFYHRAGQKVYQDLQTGQQYVSTSIYPAEANPADSRIHQINLRGLKNVSRIRFRGVGLQYPLQQVVLRAYEKKSISQRKLEYAWQRMGEEGRQRLSRVSVYDVSVVNEEEQRHLLINQWAPLGPLGVDGEDYIIQKLYVVRDVENDVILNAPVIPSTGLVIYPGRYGMLTLPEDQNQIRMSWTRYGASAKHSGTDKVTVEWWGRPASRYKKWTSLLSAGELIKQIPNGVIRISSQQPIVVQVWQEGAAKSEPLDITPKPAYLRLYSPANNSLVYKVNHIRGYKTPFRFDFRAVNDKPVPRITYRLLDKQDKLIKKGVLTLQQDLSAYDSLVGDHDRWLTEPRHVYFNLSNKVDKVRFDAMPGAWISAYSRPKNLPYVHSQPIAQLDDKSAHETESKQNIPVWFSVRPENWKDYLLKGRSQLITVQRRPPQIDKQLLAGLYRWDQFYPQGSWKGHYLLNPLDDSVPLRDQGKSSRYIKLSHKQGSGEHIAELNFLANTGTNTLRPSLVYDQTKAQALTIRVWLDETLYHEEQVFTRNGELQLPYIPSGQHQLRIDSFSTQQFDEKTVEEAKQIKTHATLKTDSIEATKTEFYINNTHNQQVKPSYVGSQSSGFNAKIMLKRMAMDIPAKPLNFAIVKEKPEELLAVRIFTRLPMFKKQKVSIKIKGLDKRKTGPFDNWTLINRQIDLPLLAEKSEINSPLILNTDHKVSDERLYFIPLGSDLPVGESYSIEVSLLEGSGAYIVLTRTIPGLYPSRQLYPDIEIEHANE